MKKKFLKKSILFALILAILVSNATWYAISSLIKSGSETQQQSNLIKSGPETQQQSITDKPGQIIKPDDHIAPALKTKFYINGNNLGRYSIVDKTEEAGAAKTIQRVIKNTLSVDLPIASSSDFRIETSIDNTLRDEKWMIRTNKGVLELRAYSKSQLNDLYKGFEDYMRENNRMNLAGDKILAQGMKISQNPVVVAHSGTALNIGSVSGTNKFVYTKTDKDATSYIVGDKITFDVYLMVDSTNVSCPKFRWEVATDGGKSYFGTVAGTSGGFSLTIPSTEVGYIRLKVFAQDASGNNLSDVTQGASTNGPTMFGAGVSVHDITQEYKEPKDFDKRWAAELDKLRTISPDVLDMKHLKTDGGYEYYTVKIKGNEDIGYITGYLTYPVGAAKGSLPIAVEYFYYDAIEPRPRTWYGRACFAVAAHSVELEQPSSYYSSLKGGELRNHGFNNNETFESLYFRKMLLRDVQALRFVKAYLGTEGVMVNGEKKALGLWDGKGLTTLGGSQGGFQALGVAGLDQDVSDVSAYIPWMCDVGGGDNSTRMKSSFRPNYTPALRYVDTLNLAKRISPNCTIIIESGLGDYTCPPSGTSALFNILKENHAVSWVAQQGRTHGYTPPKTDDYRYTANLEN